MDTLYTDSPDWPEIAAILSQHPNGWTENGFVGWLKLPETTPRLIARYGDKWTLKQALELCVGKLEPQEEPGTPEKKKRRRRRNTLALERGVVIDGSAQKEDADDEEGIDFNQMLSDLDERVEAKVTEYLSRFEDVSPADISAVRDMVRAELSSEEIYHRLNREFLSTEPKDARIKIYTDSLKNLSQQTRALQVMLNIDRASRDQEANKRSDVDEVLEIVDAAGEWVKQNATEVVHCSTHIAWIVNDFKEFPDRYSTICPKCKRKIGFERKPNEIDLLAIEPEWVEQEEAVYESEARLVRPSLTGEASGEDEEL